MSKGFAPIWVVVIMLVLVGSGIAGGYYLGLDHGFEKSVKESQVVINPTQTPSIQALPSPIVDETNKWKTYKSDELTFTYPSTWEVLNEVPEEYRAISYDINQEGWDKLHLKSKMFAPKCRGPILRNTSAKSTIIAFEVIEKTSDGAYCWSNGDFRDSYSRVIRTLTPPKEIKVNKWRIGDYTYPVTTDNTGKVYSPAWEGILFQQTSLGDKKYFIEVALVYKDGTDKTAEAVYDQILSTINIAN